MHGTMANMTSQTGWVSPNLVVMFTKALSAILLYICKTTLLICMVQKILYFMLMILLNLFLEGNNISILQLKLQELTGVKTTNFQLILKKTNLVCLGTKQKVIL